MNPNKKAPRFSIPQWPELEKAFEAIADLLDAKKIPTIKIGKGLGGSVTAELVSIYALDSSTSSSTSYLPWQPIIYPITNGSGEVTDYELSIYFGELNGFIPSNQLDGPSLERFTVPTGLTYWYVDVTTNGKGVSSMVLASSGTMPTQETPTTPEAPLAFKVLLAVTYRVGTTSCVSSHIRKSHLVAAPKLMINVPKSSWGVGELAYDPYYVWEVLDA